MFEDYNYALLFDKDKLEEFKEMVANKGDAIVFICSDEKVCASIQSKLPDRVNKVTHIAIVHENNGQINA